MKVAQSVSEILRDRVTLEVEGIDRMYLNVIVPLLHVAGLQNGAAQEPSNTGPRTYAWLYRSTAMVNQYYFYGIDRHFCPFFLKVC